MSAYFSRDRFVRFSRNPVAVAVVLTVLLILWLFSGDIFRAQTEPPEPNAAAPKETVYRVEVTQLQAEHHSPRQVVQGQLEPLRAVDIRSQISAHLTQRISDWGMQVKEGALLFRLDPETRAAELARAEADWVLREAELRAGEVLHQKNMISETEYLRLKSVAAAAKAEREAQALQLRYAQIHAPFAGIVDRLPVEEGDFVQAGQVLATLVDISSLRLIAYVPQQQVYPLRPGLTVEAALLDGTTLTGSLTFVASYAESSTRSFRVEARVQNPEGRRIAGSSATLTIALPEQQAHHLSPALLVLDEEGRLGVKVVNEAQRVEFLPVNILSFDPHGVWVDGLPESLTLIIQGAGFVAVGDAVNPVSVEP